MSTTPSVTVHYTQAILQTAERLDLPLQANAPMREYLSGLVDSLLERLGTQSLAVRVQQLQRAQPRWGKERIAEKLELSGRHLNRKLAERLGFSDESAFAKAFRRWSSMTPGQFRQGLVE